MMMRVMIFAIIVAAMSGCTSRVVHEPAAIASAPNAININAAAADELERLPGIGRKTAEAIVEYRTANGAFRRPDHVMMVRGISEQRFLEIRHLLKTQ